MKAKKNEKFILNSQLHTYQILTNNDQMLILCLSYFVTNVHTISDTMDMILEKCFKIEVIKKCFKETNKLHVLLDCEG